MHVDNVSDAYWRRPNKERTVGGWGRSVGVNRVSDCLQVVTNGVSDKAAYEAVPSKSRARMGRKTHIPKFRRSTRLCFFAVLAFV